MDTVVWVSAVASALMALAAFIALGLEVWREYRRRQDAGKRVGIAAFLLRRQLNSWLDELPTDHGFPCWANDMTKHLDRAEARATVIAHLQYIDSNTIHRCLVRLSKYSYYSELCRTFPVVLSAVCPLCSRT